MQHELVGVTYGWDHPEQLPVNFIFYESYDEISFDTLPGMPRAEEVDFPESGVDECVQQRAVLLPPI